MLYFKSPTNSLVECVYEFIKNYNNYKKFRGNFVELRDVLLTSLQISLWVGV